MEAWTRLLEQAAGLEPYSPPEDSGCIRLDLNESPFPPPLQAVEEALKLLVSANRYPRRKLLDGLVSLLSGYMGVAEDCIVVGCGGDSILVSLFSIMRGLRAAMPEHCFSMYPRLSRIYGLGVVRYSILPHGDVWVIDEASFEEAVRAADVVVIDRPNNPTGSLLVSRRVLEDTVSRNPGKLFLVDEAYAEFAGESAAGLVEYGNVVVLRTMSKAFSLAGMRLGYAAAPQPLARALRNILYPFPASAPSMAMAAAMLRMRGLVEERVRRITGWREELRAGLRRLGVVVYRSSANFLLVDTRLSDARRELERRGVCVRSTSLGGGFVRVTVGRPEENEELLEALRAALAGQDL